MFKGTMREPAHIKRVIERVRDLFLLTFWSACCGWHVSFDNSANDCDSCMKQDVYAVPSYEMSKDICHPQQTFKNRRDGIYILFHENRSA